MRGDLHSYHSGHVQTEEFGARRETLEIPFRLSSEQNEDLWLAAQMALYESDLAEIP